MPVTPLVTERFTGMSFSRGARARRCFDITGAANIKDAQDLLFSQMGIEAGKSHPLDGTIFIPFGGINIDTNGARSWLATADYQKTSGISESFANLLAQKWRILPDPADTEEVVDRDGSNKPILNSARQPPSTLMTRPYTELTISMWRYEQTYPFQLHLSLSNKTNDATVALPKLGTAAIGELFLKSIKPKEEIAVESQIVPVVYTFKARPRFQISPSNDLYHGFHKRMMDVGQMGNNSTGLNPITYKTGPHKGDQVSFDVRLNGYGVPLDSANFDVSGVAGVNLATPPAILDVTADAVFLLYDLTEGSASFAPLNIGANL